MSPHPVHPPDATRPHPARACAAPRRPAAWLALLGLCAALAACQAPPLSHSGDDGEDGDRSPAVSAQVSPELARLFPGWQPRPMPGKRWAPFEAVAQDGLAGAQVQAQSSISILSRTLGEQEAHTGPAQLRFSWWVERVLPGANLTDPSASDSPARVAVTFGGDRSGFAMRDHLLSELLQLMTGEALPHATLVYVWSNDLAPGTVLTSPRTQRIRYLVVEQGAQRVGQWVHHQRDVRADFERVFGEAPTPIVGLALMTDTDNTGGHTRTVYGPVSLAAQ